MQSKKRSLIPLCFIGPHLILFIIFILVPCIYGIYASFTQWNLINAPKWAGFSNFQTILFDKESTFHFQFFNGLKNTFLFVIIQVPLQIIVPMLFALVLQSKKLRHASTYQAILYMPGLLSISALALIWGLVFTKSGNLGMINHLFKSDVVWTVTQPHAWVTIFGLCLWAGIGGNLVIYRAAISGVSQELYESAELDGAGKIRKFISITLPTIRFPLFYTIIMTTSGAFGVFAQPLIMTKGGPNESTHVLMMYIRTLAFGSGESIAGMASAMAMLLGLIILVISALQFALLNRED